MRFGWSLSDLIEGNPLQEKRDGPHFTCFFASIA
jgi:hypothetical protein